MKYSCFNFVDAMYVANSYIEQMGRLVICILIVWSSKLKSIKHVRRRSVLINTIFIFQDTNRFKNLYNTKVNVKQSGNINADMCKRNVMLNFLKLSETTCFKIIVFDMKSRMGLQAI
jgi:hypothetical protein